MLRIVLAAALACSLGCTQTAEQYVALGNQYFEQGKYDDAALNFRKAIQRNDKHGEAYFRLATTAIKQEKGQEAYQAIQRAVELDPKNHEAKVVLADLAIGGYQVNPTSQQLYDVVSRVSATLLQEDPKDFDGLRLKGALALLDRKPAEAVESFERAQQINPFQEYLVVGYMEALLQLGQVQKAEALARGVAERKKDFGPPYDILYKHYIADNRRADAEGILRTKVANNPQRVEFALQLAAHYGKYGDTSSMQAVLKQALSRAKPDSQAYMRVGDFYATTRELESAVATYEAGRTADPPRADEYLKRVAAVRGAQGKIDEAVDILQQILARKPDDWESAGGQADMLMMRAKPADVDKAVGLYQLVLKLRPDNGAAQYNLGRAFVLKGELEKARKALAEAARLSPDSAGPRLLLAGLSLRDREPDGALRYALDALARAPADPRASFLKSTALLELARYDEARAELDKLSQRFPQSKDVQIQQGLLAILSKNFAEAERIFARLAASAPGDARAISGLAETYTAQQQFERAIRFLETERKKSPESDVLRRLIASTAARGGQYDRAIGEYGELLKKNPGAPMILMGLGDAYREKGDLPVALEHFDKALAISPNEPVLHLLRGFALQQSNKRDEAIAAYRKVLALDAKNGIAMNNLAYLLSAGSGKDLDDALDLAKRAVSGNGNQADSRDTLGWIYLKKGLPDSAAQIFESLVRDRPGNSTIQYHLGLARIQKSDFAGARQALQAALAAKPAEAEVGEIRAALAKAERR